MKLTIFLNQFYFSSYRALGDIKSERINIFTFNFSVPKIIFPVPITPFLSSRDLFLTRIVY